MLQIDHVYEFFYRNLFKDFAVHTLPNGVFPIEQIDELKVTDLIVFNITYPTLKILFIDQEPINEKFIDTYIELFKYPNKDILYEIENAILFVNQTPNVEELIFSNLEQFNYQKKDIYQLIEHIKNLKISDLFNDIEKNQKHQDRDRDVVFRDPVAIVTSEKSTLITQLSLNHNLKPLYYFFHGFAALDWYRGFFALNYNKEVITHYQYDFVTFNRLITNDRSYRCYFISLLVEKNLINKGQISFGLNDQNFRSEITSEDSKLSNNAITHINQYLPTLQLPLVIDNTDISGCASADIPRCIDNSLWHIVTETVFYYNKLHLTEKIFKPIVMKQPFMLLAAPGNLAYLKSYGFKTFDSIIDESYDTIVNPDDRIEAVVDQLTWYCNLPTSKKIDVIKAIEPIVEYNFHWFYNEFKHHITTELLDNTKSLFNELNYDDSTIDYTSIYKTLVN